MDILSELEMGEMAAVTATATKRRRYAAFLCLQGSGQGPRGPKRKKATFSWAAHVTSLTESDFRLRYRLDSAAFYELLALLREDLDYRTSKARLQAQNANCGAVVEPAVRLAIALRFLSGASIHDLTIIYNLGRSACYDCLWVVVDAVTKRMTLEFPLDDIEKLAILEI